MWQNPTLKNTFENTEIKNIVIKILKFNGELLEKLEKYIL